MRLQRTIADMRAELTAHTRGLGNVTVVDGTADDTVYTVNRELRSAR